MNPSKEVRLQKLKDICSSCHNCILGNTRKNLVFGEGCMDPEVLFIGEGPGKNEDDTGRPFVGRSGQLLRKMILAIDLDPMKECYIANVVRCRPPGNRTPEQDEIEQCKKFLLKQIEILSPKRISLLGRTAVKALFPEHAGTPLDVLRRQCKSSESDPIQNSPLTFNGIPVVVTYHPSALLMDPSRRVGAAEDFRYIEKLLIPF